MGIAKSKPARQAPARYVARPVRRDALPEEEFRKQLFTAKGINKNVEDVHTEPRIYTEIGLDETSTAYLDEVAPRWYLNSFMEMMDKQREERKIWSANLPLAWQRDKFEPYALVRNRIDDEDLKWVLSAENRVKPMEQLLESTKLEREVLQDILDYCETPRKQYRNYKGKLHKPIKTDNSFLEARKTQIETSREDELLAKIGYSKEELAAEEQYRTNRPRGVKLLDDLGASINSKKRLERAVLHSEMEELLEARRLEQIEAGKYVPSEQELKVRDEKGLLHGEGYRMGKGRVDAKYINIDFKPQGNKDLIRMHWWMDRSRPIGRARDKVYGVPEYNTVYQMNDKEVREQMAEAATHATQMARAQGQKTPPNVVQEQHWIAEIMRNEQQEREKEGKKPNILVFPDGANDRIEYRFPRTDKHPKPPSIYDKPDLAELMKDEKPEPVDTDIMGYFNKEMEKVNLYEKHLQHMDDLDKFISSEFSKKKADPTSVEMDMIGQTTRNMQFKAAAVDHDRAKAEEARNKSEAEPTRPTDSRSGGGNSPGGEDDGGGGGNSR